jgi:hypothetical protein
MLPKLLERYCSYLVTLLETTFLCGTTGHSPDDVGKESPVTSGLAAHNPHSEASGCHITPQLQVFVMTTNQHIFMYATVKEYT